jgi:hypothetical protein
METLPPYEGTEGRCPISASTLNRDGSGGLRPQTRLSGISLW